MIESVRGLAKSWLQKKEVDAIFGLRSTAGRLAPFLFTSEAELAELALSIHHRVCYTCRPPKKTVLTLMQERDPQMKIGVVCRGCDERALIEVAKRNQLGLGPLKILGVACTAAEAAECECQRPFPQNLLVGEKVDGHTGHPSVDELMAKSVEERLAFWQHALGKCIKCYGCRNACPVCFCVECKMEQELFSRVGRLPPDVPMFQFIRLLHIADKCIGCGQCEMTCPMDIPLTIVSKLLKKDMMELFGYEAGLSVENESPILLSLDDAPVKIEEAHHA